MKPNKHERQNDFMSNEGLNLLGSKPRRRLTGGPYAPEALEEIERAVIQRVAADAELRADGNDTLHTLALTLGQKPEFGDFSGGYMGNIRWVATGCTASAKPEDDLEFSLNSKTDYADRTARC